jgi:hypothetical protein
MFKTSLPGIMAGLTRQFGLKLRFGGNPKTNGQTIWMPNVPLQVGERDKVKLMGDLVHECGHITQTSFTVLRDAKLTNSSADQLLHGIWNAVEDVRMERDTMKDLLGARQYLAGSLVYQTEDGQVRNGTASPSDAIITYCYCKGAIMVNAFLGVMPSYESSRGALIQLITEDGVAMIDDLLDTKMPLLRSGKKEGTTDSFSLARDVIDLLKQMSQGQSQQQQQQQQNQEKGESGKDQDQAQADQGSNNEQSQGQESQQQEGSQNSDDKSENSDQDAKGQQESNEGELKDESSNASGQSEESDSEGSDDAQSSGEESGDAESDSQQMSQGAQSMLDDHNVDTSEFSQHDKVREEIIEKAKAEGAAFTDDVSEKGETTAQSGGLSDAPSSGITNDQGKYTEIKSGINGQIAQLRRRLIPKLESNNRTSSRLTEDRGRLDIRAAIRAVASGDSNPNVYREKIKRQTPKPAITLLVDRSGSMSGRLMRSAQEAAIALLEVCDAATIKVEVIAFDHNIDMVKSFDMPTNKAKAKIGGVDANGGTNTSMAMYQAGKRLIQRAEQRKIMMIVTDGLPSSVTDARSVHDLLKSSGIEVYGLGLGTDAVKHFCDKFSVVTADNLATTILQSFES